MRASPCTASASLPQEVWEHVFSYVEGDAERSAISEVCRSWYHMEGLTRARVFVGNCYAVSPRVAAARFPNSRAFQIKGKPHFADFNLVPSDWGGGALDWVAALAEGCPHLEELRLKRMVVTDECLEIVATSFRAFRVLSLVSCEGFSTAGLAAIAANCRTAKHREGRNKAKMLRLLHAWNAILVMQDFPSVDVDHYRSIIIIERQVTFMEIFDLKMTSRNLEELDLQENTIEDRSSHWLGCFPEKFSSLVSLSVAFLEGDMNTFILERLVGRCPNLRTLRVNHTVSLERLVGILQKAPQLIDLGTGKLTSEPRMELYSRVESSFGNCKFLKRISGVWEACPTYLSAIYPVCDGLTTLNLSYSNIQSPDLINLVTGCRNLQKLWVLDHIEDEGLEAVASCCKHLQELRVFPSDPFGAGHLVSERGLLAVSAGCSLLNSVLYFCWRMTNAALTAIARNRPNLIRFRLCIIEPETPDYLTQQPLDAGFSAIVESCKNLRRLSLSGLLTDRVFEAIGSKANSLEMLSVAFAGESDAGLGFVLSGCRNLRKLEIRDCPFGDKALLANAAKLETMRSLWMSSCSVTLGACKQLAEKMPHLNVEVMDERGGPSESWSDDCLVEKLYIYRTLAGPRSDTPSCVWTL